MAIFEISSDSWRRRLDAFTLAHEGWLASLEVFSPGQGGQPGFAELPLIGVSADPIHKDGVVAVSVAWSPREHFTHVIHGVERIHLDMPYDGADASVLVESAGGVRTILQVRAAAAPRASERR